MFSRKKKGGVQEAIKKEEGRTELDLETCEEVHADMAAETAMMLL